MVGQQRFAEINENLNKRLDEKKVLIAVHRGTWHGNICENTIPAYQIALSLGADMFECDLFRSTDGVVYAFHDGQEMYRICEPENVKYLSSKVIDSIDIRNCIGQHSLTHIPRFESIVEHFCHGELFNVDRAGDILPYVDEILAMHPGSIKQALIKTAPTKECLEFFENCPRKYMFMPIVTNMAELKLALSYENINMVGMELVAPTEDHALFQRDVIALLKEHNLFAWANTITLGGDPRFHLFGNMTDDRALLEDPAQVWGKLFEHGITAIQTDWPHQLSTYRKEYFSL